MSIATHSLAGDLMDDSEFPEMIKREEGSSLTPYYDSAGIPTIGIGINLADSSNLALVLQAVFNGDVPGTAQADFEAVLSKNYGTTAALDNAMDAQLQTYAGAPSVFKLTPEQEDSIFATVAAQKVSGLNAILAANGTPLDNNSAEFMALLSLYYNQQSSNPLVGPRLLADLKAGNRAEVWYQIRYQSDARDPNGGLQKGRFYESAVFSLDGSTSSVAQAEQDYEMLTVHRGTILGKEAATVFQRNQPLQIGVNPDAPTFTYTVLDEANSNYSLTGGSGGPVKAPVQTLGTEFYNEGVLITTDLDSLYGSVLPQIEVTNPSDFFSTASGDGSFQVSSTDIFIAESAGPVASTGRTSGVFKRRCRADWPASIQHKVSLHKLHICHYPPREHVDSAARFGMEMTILRVIAATLFGMVGCLLLASSRAEATDSAPCIRQIAHFDGSKPLKFDRVIGSSGARLYVHASYPKSCNTNPKSCAGGHSYLITGDEVASGQNCGAWTYIQYIGARRITRGWVDNSRLRFLRDVGAGAANPLFKLTKGRGTPVCETYLQRLNVTDYRQNIPNAPVPYCGIPENDEIPGFALLHRVPLSSQQIIRLSGSVYKWWERPNPHLTADWNATLEQVRSGGVVAWRYDPPLDVNNDGEREDIIAWRGYGLSGAAGRCGEPGNQNYTWNVRWQQLPLIMNKNLQIDQKRTAEVFGRVSTTGSRQGDDTAAGHPFTPIGIFITPVVYKGTTYFSAFFDDSGDYAGKRQGSWRLWNVMGLLKRSDGKEQEICEYRLGGDDYPKAHTGLEQ